MAKRDLNGFSIEAKIRNFSGQSGDRGQQVIVHSDSVQKPVAVRYGWADFPVVNFWNKEGLPASPFRTDNFR